MELKQDRASAAAALALARYVGAHTNPTLPLSPLLGGIRQGGAKTKIGIGES